MKRSLLAVFLVVSACQSSAYGGFGERLTNVRNAIAGRPTTVDVQPQTMETPAAEPAIQRLPPVEQSYAPAFADEMPAPRENPLRVAALPRLKKTAAACVDHRRAVKGQAASTSAEPTPAEDNPIMSLLAILGVTVVGGTIVLLLARAFKYIGTH